MRSSASASSATSPSSSRASPPKEQGPGSRTRFSYHATAAGKDLTIPLAALQQWGDEHNAPPVGPTVARRSAAGKSVRVAFLDEANEAVPVSDVIFVKTAAYPK
jgi:hypothetical protein